MSSSFEKVHVTYYILPVLVNNISFAGMAKRKISKCFHKTIGRRGDKTGEGV